MTEIQATQGSETEMPRPHHVCPWWVAYLLTLPIRRLGEDPETMLGPWVGPRMTVVDIGCARGYFSLPLARMVGERGVVHCVDVQDRLLRSLDRRARRAGLGGVIRTRHCSQEDLGLHDLAETADLVLAAHVVHEAAYPRRCLEQCLRTLKPGGVLLLVEPDGHVSDEEFEETLRLAESVGFERGRLVRRRRSRELALRRPRPTAGAVSRAVPRRGA